MEKRNQVRMRLVLDVTYAADDEALSEIEAQGNDLLEALVQTASNRGLLTGDIALEVDEMSCSVYPLPLPPEGIDPLFEPENPKTLGQFQPNRRGFPAVTFKDAHDKSCSVAASSVIYDYKHSSAYPGSSAIWLGIDDPEPEVMARDAAKLGLKAEKDVGWIPFPLPPEVSLRTHMHIKRAQVPGLIRRLEEWMASGSFDGDPNLEREEA